MKNKFLLFLGLERQQVSHTERLVSGLGGFVAIAMILLVSHTFLDEPMSLLIVASMGASAVLLFVVPHGPLSQPWNVLGGHFFSAFIGVACAQLVANEIVAASLAVGIAISVMYYLGCVHPPGGATALTAVAGGTSVHDLGFQFVLTPVLLNVLIILGVALLFNYRFPWRRYPVYLHKSTVSEKSPEAALPAVFSHADFQYAMRELDSFVDISEEDLIRIYRLAQAKSQEPVIAAEDVLPGGCYSNGQFGDNWSVRLVVDEKPDPDPEKAMVVYKVVAGRGRRDTGYSTKREFLRWARYRVIRDEENWKKFS